MPEHSNVTHRIKLMSRFVRPVLDGRKRFEVRDDAEVRTPSEERDTRIPYRLGTNHFCSFEGEDDGSYVKFGHMVEFSLDTYNGEVSFFGELCGVRYGEDGFIESASLYTKGDEMVRDIPCEGVFWRMSGGDPDAN